MSKYKIGAAGVALAVVIGVGCVDHVRQKAQILTLQRLVTNLEHRMTVVGASARSGSAPFSAQVRSQSGAASNQDFLRDDLAARGTLVRDFRDVGRGTPRAAFETFNWALAAGKVDEVAKVITVDDVSRQKLEALLDSLPPSTREQFPDSESLPATMIALEGLMKDGISRVFQVENETIQPDGTVRFDYASIVGGQSLEKTIYFQNGAAGWQTVVPAEAIDRIPAIISDPMLFQAALAGGKVKGMQSLSDRK